MKPIVITVSGQARSGKDTFIEKLGQAMEAYQPGRPFGAASSIDPIRDTLFPMVKKTTGIALAEHKDDPGSVMDIRAREVLASVKKILDTHLSFTLEMALRHLITQKNGILAFQIREDTNLTALRHDQRIDVLAVHLLRRLPNTGRYFRYQDPDGCLASADYVFDSVLDDMTMYADIVARRVARIVNGNDVSSSYAQ